MDLFKKKIIPGVFIGFIVIILMIPFIFLNPLEGVHLRLANLLYRENNPSLDITIIAIDEKSLDPESGLGSYRDWPRSYFAQALQNLKKQNPKVIAFDFDFSNPSKNLSLLRVKQLVDSANAGVRVSFYEILSELVSGSTHPDDDALSNEIKGAGSVVTATPEKVYRTADGVYIADHEISPIFETPSLTEGFAFILADQDERVRKFLRHIQTADASGTKESFAMEIATAAGEKNPLWDTAKDPSLIYFQAPPNTYKRISFVDLLAGPEHFDPELIRGKIVMIGATASVLQDIRKTPISETPMPGVEIQGNIVQQIMDGKFLGEQGNWSQFLMIAVWAIIGSVLLAMLPIMHGTIVFLLSLAIFAFSAKIAFTNFNGDGAVLLNLINPPIAFLFMYVGGLWYHNETELKEKRQTKKAFSHYVNEDVVSEILRHPEKLKLGGEKKVLSVLFTDIVSFTSLTEKTEPEELVSILNEYLDAMSQELLKNGATLDKFEGDAIMAFFGAPIAHADHAKRACVSALAMRGALNPLHEKWNKEGRPLLDFCVGISTGEMIVGNFGSKDRFDYTVIGDNVNLGSRLESANRIYGTKILVDEPTFLMIPDNTFTFRKIDRIRVKGKSKPVVVYELLGVPEYLSNTGKTWLSDFESGIKFYEKREFAEAEKYFDSALRAMPNDGPSRIYKNRCRFLAKNSPPEDWDFVVDLESK